MSNQIAAGTAEGLMEYCDYLIDKGYAGASAVNPWKSAAKQVFATVEDGEDYGSLDVKNLDLDEYMGRFETKARGKLKQESVVAYRQRVRKALDSYRDYLDNPNGWRPPTMRQGPKRTSADQATTSKANGNSKPTNGNGNGHAAEGNGSNLIDYPFPLQSGQIAHVRLPAKLEKGDAERLATFVRTLVFEPVLELTEKAGQE
jgi:hypothetical protein